MEAITNAIDAMQKAHDAFCDHGLLSAEECVVCRRIVNGGVHASDCPVDGLLVAIRRLTLCKGVEDAVLPKKEPGRRTTIAHAYHSRMKNGNCTDCGKPKSEH